MSCKYLVILICLLIILYLYNKNQVYEKVEHFDDNVISQIASIVNGDKVILKNVDITGTLNAPNINTYQVNSTNKDKWIDFKGKPVFYEDAKFNDDKSLKVKNIYTQFIKPGYSEWVNFPGKVDLQSTFRLRGDDIKGKTATMAGKQSWLTW